MDMSSRELWTALHGMIFGAAFLLAFTGGFFTLWDLRSELIAPVAVRKAVRRLIAWTWAMTVLVWLTVVLGTYLIYPWYRAKAPAGSVGPALAAFPKALLLSSTRTAGWHEFGMEWKEHVAWLAPILATAVAVIVTRYWKQLLTDRRLRGAVLMVFTLAFACASLAGLLGALIDKAAPVK